MYVDPSAEAIAETQAGASVAEAELAAQAAVATTAIEQQGETERAQLLAEALRMRDEDRAAIAALESRLAALEAAQTATAMVAAAAAVEAEEAQAAAEEAAEAAEEGGAPDGLTELQMGEEVAPSAGGEEVPPAGAQGAEERKDGTRPRTRHQEQRDRRLHR